MVDGYSADQIRAAEAPHLAAGEPLMERASAGLAAHIRSLLEAHGRPAPHRVLLLVGSGNNGGDALYAGARLARDGAIVVILPTGTRLHEQGLAAAMAEGARLIGHTSAAKLHGSAQFLTLAADVDVIVDGILGIGSSDDHALRGVARQVVAGLLPAVDAMDGPLVVAVDIPSGIHPDTGAVTDSTVLPADLTVTFGGVKAGLLLGPARRLAGTVRLVDVGIGDDLAAVTPAVRT